MAVLPWWQILKPPTLSKGYTQFCTQTSHIENMSHVPHQWPKPTHLKPTKDSIQGISIAKKILLEICLCCKILDGPDSTLRFPSTSVARHTKAISVTTTWNCPLTSFSAPPTTGQFRVRRLAQNACVTHCRRCRCKWKRELGEAGEGSGAIWAIHRGTRVSKKTLQNGNTAMWTCACVHVCAVQAFQVYSSEIAVIAAGKL